MLDQDHISILMLKNVLLEDLEDKLAEVSQEANMQINYLSAIVVPEDSSLARATPDFYLRVVAYAIDSLNELVPNDALER